MNDEDVTKILGQVVPDAPSPDAWAGAAVRRARRRRIGGVAAVVALALVAVPMGAMMFNRPLVAGPAESTGEVTGDVMILGSADAPELCLGAIRESYPPQCGGPALKGDFRWEQVEFEEANGVRWTNSTYTVRGHYDPDDGDSGSFTLTAPPVVAPLVQEPAGLDFPQLCDDPYADGGDPGAGGEAPDGSEALHAAAAELPVVTMYVSDGSSNFNVLVQGDADEAFRALRAVWKGGLCVQSSDAPTEARRMEVLGAVMAALPDGQLVTADAGGMKPEVNVHVVIITPEIEAAVRKAAKDVPVTLTAVFNPVGPDTPTQTPSTDPTAPVTPPASDLPTTDPDSPTSSDSTLTLRTLRGTARILQKEGELPRLCVREAWEATEPFSCEGPTLKGDVNWDEIPHTTDQGVLVSDGHYTVTGTYDPTDGDPGSLTLDGPPVFAGQPGVEFERYSTLCAEKSDTWRDDPRWPTIVIAPDPEGHIPLPDPQGWVCSRLTGAVADDKLDAILDALPTIRDPRIVGYSRDGNDLVVKVLAADDKLMDMVYAVVEETGMPVVVRTALTPPGENDTTIVAPSR